MEGMGQGRRRGRGRNREGGRGGCIRRGGDDNGEGGDDSGGDDDEGRAGGGGGGRDDSGGSGYDLEGGFDVSRGAYGGGDGGGGGRGGGGGVTVAISVEDEAARRGPQVSGQQTPIDMDLNEPPSGLLDETFALGDTPFLVVATAPPDRTGPSRPPGPTKNEDEVPLAQRAQRIRRPRRCFTGSHLFRLFG
nr:glycine-rich cell wall structural protein 1.0-like [Arachis hypogaea]